MSSSVFGFINNLVGASPKNIKNIDIQLNMKAIPIYKAIISSGVTDDELQTLSKFLFNSKINDVESILSSFTDASNFSHSDGLIIHNSHIKKTKNKTVPKNLRLSNKDKTDLHNPNSDTNDNKYYRNNNYRGRGNYYRGRGHSYYNRDSTQQSSNQKINDSKQ